MTFLTKPSLIVKKTPLIDGKCDEEVIEVGGPPPPYWAGSGRASLCSMMCTTFAAFLVTLAGLATGLLLYRQYLRGPVVPRYQGFCTIPIKELELRKGFQPQVRVMPVRWSMQPSAQVLSAAEDQDEAERALREVLDIDDQLEKITVVDNARTVTFYHDFNSNVSGIADVERCFIMDMDPELVLSPDMFVLRIASNADFDTSHVRSTLRAALPAMQQQVMAIVNEMIERCNGKPMYKLVKGEGIGIRKRSVDAPPHDYIQFAGRHVQEIQISNLADLLQHEQELATRE